MSSSCGMWYMDLLYFTFLYRYKYINLDVYYRKNLLGGDTCKSCSCHFHLEKGAIILSSARCKGYRREYRRSVRRMACGSLRQKYFNVPCYSFYQRLSAQCWFESAYSLQFLCFPAFSQFKTGSSEMFSTLT